MMNTKRVHPKPWKPFSKVGKGTFLARPNRFLVRCRFKGETITAYLPNPGRMKELLLPGKTLYITQEASSPTRKTTCTVLAVEHQGRPIFLHTHKTNDAARYLIENDMIEGLQGAEIIAAEVTRGSSRFDFLLSFREENLLLEVKSCTLVGQQVAMFPDAVTERGARHVRELAELGENGYATAILFVVHWARAEIFMPDFHTDLTFAQTLLECRSKVNIMAVAVAWDHPLKLIPGAKVLEIPWPLIEKEAHDRGAYLVLFRLSRAKSVTIGKLGKLDFPAGYYFYVGSAMANLSPRIQRHRRLHKQSHWHIDYLRPHLSFVDAFAIRASDRLECSLAQALATISDWSLSGFGCTDCSCASHLFGIKENPLEDDRFFELLLWFRMDRLR